ncbi:iron chelate uptake ABC transporter family permease subunit [Phaeobacter sp. B1627]|uniref:metal ABC transporter permease n=1 Tax=Phaeobacter sp. B1627 TaxID=2583809 RepID=UPI001118BA16|nr:iron chelate uptake ABC transporter family permease subunit [Phaeobacter sp. B1627]TNJ45920.1 hypothetical protein FGE21_05840 [Phaeobacter sp. B1627]
MSFFDDFIVLASLAGIGVAIAAAPLGCFVVWRRMAYFGDATAHAAILGVALALTFQTSILGGVLVMALLMAGTISALSGRGYAMDTLLGVLAHSALALGLVAVSFLKGVRVDLMAYLFGDILAVSLADVAIVWSGALLILILLWWRWSSLLTATLNPELARASGISPQREQMIMTLALAIVVAVAIKVVGVLLITAMLLIPAATARTFSSSPERMAVMASLVGSLSVIGGLFASFRLDTPTGPTIVATGTAMFIGASLTAMLNSRGR